MAAPTPTSSDKPFGISQIRAYIPIILDLEKMNVWRELFETHCLTYGVLGHLDGTTVASSDSDKAWKERDGLVKMWIYGTIADSLTETILKPKSTARDLWLSLEGNFRDNKENRALQLENELRTITIGDLSVQEYCRKIKSLSDLLTNVDSPVSDRQLVMHCLNGLNEKFDGIHNVIRHRTPFPSFSTARSMLQSEEDRLKQQLRHTTPSPVATTSSPTVLYSADNASPPTHNNHNNNTNRGSYKSRGRGGGGRGNRGRGRHNSYGSHNNGPPPFGGTGPTPFGYPPIGYGPPQWPYPYYQGPLIQAPYPNQFHQPAMPRSNGILGQFPASSPAQAHLSQTSPPPHSTPLVPTALAQAFNTMTLQEPSDSNWYMDTAATNHITTQPGSTEQDNPTPM
ncbi:PREDICTED: uncharacterized protein LOC104754388 [Camelina sativa]|uniref:Uncharacterized protein LOC104754388 n=1 Tax=Camelina sativa TaxID=90675 RepID=A0ABM0WQV7_CAMSA|nr:PREDICTED: uncharacterized protein LOC104754388 [Camelina sativa]